MLDEQRMFTQTLELLGRRVEVGSRKYNDHAAGEVINVMFDSFLLRTDQGNRVVRFDDLIYLRPC